MEQMQPFGCLRLTLLAPYCRGDHQWVGHGAKLAASAGAVSPGMGRVARHAARADADRTIGAIRRIVGFVPQSHECRKMAPRPLLVFDGDSFAHRAFHVLPKSIRRRGGTAAAPSCMDIAGPQPSQLPACFRLVKVMRPSDTMCPSDKMQFSLWGFVPFFRFPTSLHKGTCIGQRNPPRFVPLCFGRSQWIATEDSDGETDGTPSNEPGRHPTGSGN
jgi:hypothetical protein